jgi:N-acetylglucosaminylphosphatidylinositol deacetylase
MALERRARRNWSRVAYRLVCEKRTMCSLSRASMCPSLIFFFCPPRRDTLTDGMHRDFPDSMTTAWSSQKIASLLSSAFAPKLTKPMKSKSNEVPTATIDVLITFDKSGVSSHPNHISLFHGAHHFISQLVHNRPGWQCPVDLYTLTSISIVRKYTSFLDSIFSILALVVKKKQMGEHPSPLLFMSGPGEVRTAQRAMTTAHNSQMRWFRWGWIGLSRYMVVNDLKLEKVVALKHDE